MAKKRQRYLYGFSARLDNAIWEKQYSRKYVANQVGLERKTIYSYLNQTSSPDAFTLARLCTVLDISADWLLFGRSSGCTWPKEVPAMSVAGEKETAPFQGRPEKQ